MGRLEKQIIASALALVGILLSVVIINGLEANPGSQHAKVLTQYPDARPPLVITEASGTTASQNPRVTAKVIKFGPSLVVLHRVALGESIWSIAESQLGSRDAYTEILKLNPSLAEGPLRPGDKIWLPKISTTLEVATDPVTDSVLAFPPERKEPRTHKVVSGDSLWKIAKKYYGSGEGKHRLRIVHANRVLKSEDDVLRLGMRLVIPE